MGELVGKTLWIILVVNVILKGFALISWPWAGVLWPLYVLGFIILVYLLS